MSKIKSNKSKLKLECTNCFKSNHIVFNFAYLTFYENFEKDDKCTLIDRMMELSNVPYLELMRWDKHKGFEEVRLDIRKEIPNEFNLQIERFDGKYTVMRLNKSNYPTPRKNNWKVSK